MIRSSNYNVLIVDDDSTVRQLLSKSINNLKNVTVDSVSSLDESKEKISNKIYQLIICDYYLNPGTAIDLLEYSRLINPKVPVIVITGGSDDEKKESLKNGATVFFSKPYDYLEITYIVKNILDLYDANENLDSAENIIIALSKAIEAKDSYTEGHSQRVAKYAIKIYDKIGIGDEKEKKSLYVGCILHDIGKIAIPDSVLKSEIHPLNENDYEIIKTHTVKGYEMCKDLENLKETLPVIRNHHEKLNGSGYPDKLKDEEIPLIVQIATVADIYDALTSKRSYRNSNSSFEAIKIMKENAKNKEISEYLVSILEQVVLEEE